MKVKQLQEWALIAEIIGGAAVVISLIFLIFQVNENTSAVRAQELGSLIEQKQGLLLSYMEYNEFYTRALLEPESLTPEDILQLTNITTNRLNLLERYYDAYRIGILSDVDWANEVEAVPIYLGSSYGEILWPLLKEDYLGKEGFVSEIDRSLQNSSIIPDDVYLVDLINRFEMRYK